MNDASEESKKNMEVEEYIYEGNWYNINDGTIVKCIGIINGDIIIGLLYRDETREPITKLFSMNNNDNDEYEVINTFEKIDYQAYLCWSIMDGYDTYSATQRM